jgi:hypothetical protein
MPDGRIPRRDFITAAAASAVIWCTWTPREPPGPRACRRMEDEPIQDTAL